jgi:putative ABC transport system permease protein
VPRPIAIFDGIIADVRFAVRALRHAPGFALTAIGMLALGIGANATVFTLSRAVLFSGFPSVANNDRIAYVASSRSSCCLSYPDFLDWRERTTSLEGMAVVRGIMVSLSDTAALPEGRDATEVSADTFRLIGRTPAVGRDFTAADELPGAAPVAILSYGFWERRYGKDPAILGRVVRVNAVPTTVIGVMPEDFYFPQKTDVWLPLVPTEQLLQRDNRTLWFAFGRVAPGATFASVQAELDAIGSALAADYPATNRDYMPKARTFNEFFVGPNENVIYATLWGAVLFVLLITCFNLANLMLARATTKSREISLRMALGAGSWRLVRQLVTESLLLSCIGGFFGWWLTRWMVQAYALADRGPGRAPWRVLDYAVDERALLYLIAISVGAGILFGLAPARRLAKLDINTSLKEGERGASRSAGRISAMLVTSQVALAAVLVAGAGLMVRSYLTVTTAESGVRSAGVLTGYVEVPPARYGTREALELFDGLRSRLQDLPAVEAVSMASAPPTWGATQSPYELDGQPAAEQSARPTTSSLVVGPDYFRTLDAPVLLGREFDDTDGTSTVQVALVNQLFAKRHWPEEQAVGKRLRLFDERAPDAWLTVVGVVGNIVQTDMARQQQEPIVYVSSRQAPPSGMWVFLRTRGPPHNLADDFRREVQALDPDLPVLLGPYTLEQRMAEAYWNNELYAVSFMGVAAIALLLAAIGLYAIVAFSVSTHTKEIGIRLAVGADTRHVLKLVFRQGMAPLAAGLTIGLLMSLTMTRLLQSMLVGVSPTDPGMLGLAALVLIVAAALGCWVPARRALRVSPVVVLRHE